MVEFMNAQYSIDNDTDGIVDTLLNTYDRVMVLKLFVDCNDVDLRYTYDNAARWHNDNLLIQVSHIDAGFDLFAPLIDGQNTSNNEIHFFGPNRENNSPVNKRIHPITRYIFSVQIKKISLQSIN